MIPVRIATAIVGTGVALAGVVLWRAAAFRRARWIIAGLTVYGVAGFVHAALNSIALHDVIAGRGLFQKLPFILKSAIIGLLVLSLGWIVAIPRTTLPRLRKRSLHNTLYQVLALTLCVVMVFTSFFETSGATSAFAMDPKARAAALDHSLRAIEDGERDSPRDRWDPDYVVSMVGRDPQDLYEWVRGNTYWIPYRGVLRGAVGVLMDSQGNSLDRSLLLATLLEKAGYTVRLAHGEMTREDALILLPGLVSDRTLGFTTPKNLDATPNPDIRTIAARYELDGSQVERAVNEQEQAVTRISSDLDARVADQTERLLQAFRTTRSDDWGQRFERSIAALRDHWWVQRQNGQEWVDMDLLAAQSNAGHTSVPVNGTSAIEEIAADQYHEITIRVIAEQWSAGTLAEHSALEHVLRPANLIGQPIVLQFSPADWLADSTPQLQAKPDFRAFMLNQHQWSAGLVVGRKVVASAALQETGDDGEAAGKGGEFGGVADALANSLGGSITRHEAKNKTLSAVWLEYEIRVPGEKPRTIRRTVFDLVGPSARSASTPLTLTLDDAKRISRGLSLTMKTEILPVVCQLAPEFVAHLTVASLSANKDLLRDLASNDVSPHSEKTQQQLANSPPPVTPLLALAFSRLEWNGSADEIFQDQPNIFTRHESFVNAGNEIILQDAIDIVANEVGIDLNTHDAFAARLRQGVRDTNGEALIGSGAASGNAGEAFRVSRDWLTVAPAQRGALDGLKFSEDVRRRIVQDLDDGYVVVAPRAAKASPNDQLVGWWRIDPASGTAIGVGGNGWGQSMVERGRLTTLAVTFSRSFLFEYGLCQSFPLAVNSLIVINEELFGGWHPSWTGPSAKSRDPLEIANENMHMCLIQAITAGFIATLPLLLMTLKYSRLGRRLAFARRATREPHPRRPSPCLVMGPMPARFPVAVYMLSFAALFSIGDCEPKAINRPAQKPQTPSEPVDPFRKTDPDLNERPTQVSPKSPTVKDNWKHGRDLGPGEIRGADNDSRLPRDFMEQRRNQATQDYADASKRARDAEAKWWDDRMQAKAEGKPMPEMSDELKDAVANAEDKARRLDDLTRDAKKAPTYPSRPGDGRTGDTQVSGPNGSPTAPQLQQACPPNCGSPQTGQTLVGLGGVLSSLGGAK